MKLYFNGHLHDAQAPLFTAANRGFRYGDGLFETIKVLRGEALLWPLHLERLQKGIAILQLDGSDLHPDFFLQQIKTLCQHNECADAARVRLALYRDDDNKAAYVLQAEPLSADAFLFNEQGWKLNLYPDLQKSPDILANLKTANYLLYVLAGRHAEKQGCDESLVCNTLGNICDGSRTNIFLYKNEKVFTPALQQGCVAGVMRRYILEHCRQQNIPVHETALTPTDLLQADEVFLTNAIQGIRWVNRFEQKKYGNAFSKQLFNDALATIYR